MHNEICVRATGADHLQMGVTGGNAAAVTFLTTRLAIKGCRLGNNLDHVARLSTFHLNAVFDNGQYRAIGRHFVITDKTAAHAVVVKFLIDMGNSFLARAFPMFPCLFALALHTCFKTAFVNSEAFTLNNIGSQICGKTKCVVQLEKHVSWDDRRACSPQGGHFIIEYGQAAVQCLGETLLLCQDNLFDVAFPFQKLGVSLGHHVPYRIHSMIKHRLRKSEHLGVTGGAAHDTAQHIAAPLVAWQSSITDQEGNRTGMVSNHPH